MYKMVFVHRFHSELSQKCLVLSSECGTILRTIKFCAKPVNLANGQVLYRLTLYITIIYCTVLALNLYMIILTNSLLFDAPLSEHPGCWPPVIGVVEDMMRTIVLLDTQGLARANKSWFA